MFRWLYRAAGFAWRRAGDASILAWAFPTKWAFLVGLILATGTGLAEWSRHQPLDHLVIWTVVAAIAGLVAAHLVLTFVQRLGGKPQEPDLTAAITEAKARGRRPPPDRPTISFDPNDNFLDGGTRHFKVAIKNTTPAHLEECQLFLRTTHPDGSHEKEGEEGAITAPFELKRGQTVSKPFIQIQEGREIDGVSIENFTLYQARWEETISTSLLRPGLYFLRITSLSKYAAPGELNLRLEHIHGKWTLTESSELAPASAFRMSVIELCREAAKQHGWRIFEFDKENTAVKFAKCVAQGALDGSFKVWGSDCGNYDMETAARVNPLVVIPASDFERYWIDLPPALNATDNRHVATFDPEHTRQYTPRHGKIYVNLHAERAPALEWLRTEAPALMKINSGERT